MRLIHAGVPRARSEHVDPEVIQRESVYQSHSVRGLLGQLNTVVLIVVYRILLDPDASQNFTTPSSGYCSPSRNRGAQNKSFRKPLNRNLSWTAITSHAFGFLL